MTNAQAALIAATQGSYHRDATARAAIYKAWLDDQDAAERAPRAPFERCVYALHDGSTPTPSQCKHELGHGGMCHTDDGRKFHGGPFFGR